MKFNYTCIAFLIGIIVNYSFAVEIPIHKCELNDGETIYVRRYIKAEEVYTLTCLEGDTRAIPSADVKTIEPTGELYQAYLKRSTDKSFETTAYYELITKCFHLALEIEVINKQLSKHQNSLSLCEAMLVVKATKEAYDQRDIEKKAVLDLNTQLFSTDKKLRKLRLEAKNIRTKIAYFALCDKLNVNNCSILLSLRNQSIKNKKGQ